mgnify:CR=1 FL=1
MLRRVGEKGDKPLYLIDTSALYPLILQLRENIVEIKDKIRALSLTHYEIGNVLWKEFRKGKIKNLERTVKMFTAVLDQLKVIHIGTSDLGEVLNVALENKITYYDAAYVYASRKYNLKLVTLDRDLLKFENTIPLNMFLKEIKKNLPA